MSPVPEWLIGLLSGVALTAFGLWLQERREARRRGIGLIAKLHVIFEDIRPGPLLYVAGLDQERAQRAGADLWQRWRDLREPLHVFAFESSRSVQRFVKEATTHLSLSIQATRNAINEADDRETAAELRRIAEDAYKIAGECIDDLDVIVAGRKLNFSLRPLWRRTRPRSPS
jgi:hypothetical protein